jgi:hypothetical protein
MKQKLYETMIAFIVAWTLAQVFQEPHRQALVYSISMTVAYAIFTGLHFAIWDSLKKMFTVEHFKL